jgi:hypothetical protein
MRNSLILWTLMIEAIRSSETSVLTRAARRHIPDEGILDSRIEVGPECDVILHLNAFHFAKHLSLRFATSPWAFDNFSLRPCWPYYIPFPRMQATGHNKASESIVQY